MEYIIKKIDSNIGRLTINRPDSLNAMNKELIEQLMVSTQEMIDDSSVGVIIITGSGDKSFIAGADIKKMQQMGPEEALQFGKMGQDLTVVIENSPKPVIAAVNGFALGGGCEISLACHIRIASENAKFGQPEVLLGILPGWGGTQRLPRIVGYGIANEIITTGKMISASEAYRI
ncbi:MAG: enoyl-CoA hydratase-related protein, partial [Candidatus Neomarinimicrobiota bacterium]|nr:enoyl-CoA hydratase-related protein [Candidatus Neomarinimicrobiota bacterium]